MAKSRSDDSSSHDDELRDALERLIQRVEVLTEAIDAVHDEVQWRNNERRDHQSALPTVLRSMPADPDTDDWHEEVSKP